MTSAEEDRGPSPLAACARPIHEVITVQDRPLSGCREAVRGGHRGAALARPAIRSAKPVIAARQRRCRDVDIRGAKYWRNVKARGSGGGRAGAGYAARLGRRSVGARTVPGRHPPQRHGRVEHRREELSAAAQDLAMHRPVDVAGQRLPIGPRRQVDDDPSRFAGVPAECLDGGRVAVLGLQTPHEPRRGIGRRIDRLQGGDEVRELRICLAALATLNSLPARARTVATPTDWVPSHSLHQARPELRRTRSY